MSTKMIYIKLQEPELDIEPITDHQPEVERSKCLKSTSAELEKYHQNFPIENTKPTKRKSITIATKDNKVS